MVEVREFLQRRDEAYVASFEPKEAEKVQKLMDKIKINDDYRILSDKLDRIYNDHKIRSFEPIKLAKSGNKLVNEGLVALAEMQVGKRTRQFNYYVIGESEQPVNIKDDRLYEEVARVKIPDAGGTFIQRQSTIFYSVFFKKTVKDCDVRETGIVDASNSTSDRMLLRTVLPTLDFIPHKKNFDTVFVAHTIYSGSV